MDFNGSAVVRSTPSTDDGFKAQSPLPCLPQVAHARPVSSSPAPLCLAAAVLGYAVVLFAPQVLNDGDTYWHIAAGAWILQHGVPSADPFSGSVAGAPWVPVEWLSEVLMALAYRSGGWNGIVMLYGSATALTFGLLAHDLQERAAALPAAILLVLAASCVSGSLLARPHMLALLALEVWTAGLLAARRAGRAPAPALLAVMALWANLHGSFAFGLALVVPFGIESVMEQRRAARGWGLFLAAAVLASLLTPYGWRGLALPLQLMRLQQLGGIGEWQPTSFATLQGIELGLLVVVGVAWWRGLRLGGVRLAVLLGLLHLALQHARHQMLAGVVGALILGEPFGAAFGFAGRTATRAAAARAAPAWVGAGAALLLLTALRLAEPVRRHDDATSPITALSQVPPDLAGKPVFNAYGFGGYLIFKGIRPFIDSRADLYGDVGLSRYGAVLAMDGDAFERFADANAIAWTILPPESPLVRVLDRLPGWRRVTADGVAVVHGRARQEGQGSALDPLGAAPPDPHS